MIRPHIASEPNGELPARLVQAMLNAVEKNYGCLIAEARKEWERKFAGAEPSDACVTVRINGIDSQKFALFFPLEYSRQLESSLTN